MPNWFGRSSSKAVYFYDTVGATTFTTILSQGKSQTSRTSIKHPANIQDIHQLNIQDIHQLDQSQTKKVEASAAGKGRRLPIVSVFGPIDANSQR